MAEDPSVEVPAPNEVEPGLWTCAEAALPGAVAGLGITHLISIGYPPPDDPTGGVPNMETLSLTLEDEDDGDLLTQIPNALAFISNGLKQGNVLVHCHAGQSRSVAVATAHLMRSQSVNVDEALTTIKKNNKNAQPNDGFISQLNLWHSMGCRLNMADEAFKMYTMAKMAREREYNGYVEATSVRPDPGAEVGMSSTTPFSGTSASSLAPAQKNGGGTEAGVLISCRKCRRLVARGANALLHEPGEGMDAFSWRKRAKQSTSNTSSEQQCAHIFLEPLAWMKDIEEGPTEGKLCCPKCDVKLGHFNWVGSRCACSAWVAPSFYVQQGKVDVMKHRAG